jgi:hypothetical protein
MLDLSPYTRDPDSRSEKWLWYAATFIGSKSTGEAVIIAFIILLIIFIGTVCVQACVRAFTIYREYAFARTRGAYVLWGALAVEVVTVLALVLFGQDQRFAGLATNLFFVSLLLFSLVVLAVQWYEKRRNTQDPYAYVRSVEEEGVEGLLDNGW